MIPHNQAGPVQQQAPKGWEWGSAGRRTTESPVPTYAMRWQADNWVYFGATGFPASSTQYHGQDQGPLPGPADVARLFTR